MLRGGIQLEDPLLNGIWGNIAVCVNWKLLGRLQKQTAQGASTGILSCHLGHRQLLVTCVYHLKIHLLSGKTNIAGWKMHPIEDVFPIQHGDIP